MAAAVGTGVARGVTGVQDTGTLRAQEVTAALRGMAAEAWAAQGMGALPRGGEARGAAEVVGTGRDRARLGTGAAGRGA